MATLRALTRGWSLHWLCVTLSLLHLHFYESCAVFSVGISSYFCCVFQGARILVSTSSSFERGAATVSCGTISGAEAGAGAQDLMYDYFESVP